MNDDQQPNQDKPEEMTNPWPEESKNQANEEAQPTEASSLDTPEPQHDVVPPSDAPSVDEQPLTPIVPPTNVVPVTPVPGQPVAPTAVPVENPGQVLGIVSIVLAVFAIWVFGLPLAIVSIVKSSKAKASKALGIVGLILNIVSLLISGLIVLGIFLAIPALQKASEEAEKQSTSLNIAAGGTIPLTVDYIPTNPAVSFTIPTGYLGWTMTSTEKDGVNEFTKDDDSATFMTYHGVLAGYTGTDKEATQQAMADYISQLDAIEVSNSESTVSFLTTSDGRMLQFETKQITSESEGEPIAGIVAVRMYAGHELSVIYLANADSFSLKDWDNLTSQVKLNDGTL